MDVRKGKEKSSLMVAVENLTNMSEIDLKISHEMEEEGESRGEIDWRDPRQALSNESELKETFRILHRYLQNMVRKDRNSLSDAQVMKGIQALMLLANEAVAKMDKYAALYPKQYKPVSNLKEYTDLKKYYLQQILHQGKTPKEVPEEWEADLKEGIETVEEHKRGLRDLEAVRTDQHYELFFIKNEANKPYYNRGLLRHIRLVGNFDELVSKTEGEDPLLSVREVLDRDLHAGAKEALQLIAPYADEFYKEAMRKKDRPFIGDLNKAIMALRMAANPKNLIENQSFKSCLEYYGDFHRFLRSAMQAPGYRDRIAEKDLDSFSHSLLTLTHALCCAFFMRLEPNREGVKLLHQMIERGSEMRGPRPAPVAEEKELQVWTDLNEKDLSLVHLLDHYPNGPILRILDAFREEEEFEGFDPLTHANFPSQLFTIISKEMHLTVLRLPCPTKQEYINKAEVVEEFDGFLRYYQHELKPDKHLIVNMQDRTSWQEIARCRALEQHVRLAEHIDTVHLLGLPKNGDFYAQTESYESMNGAPIFIEQFKLQLEGGEGCGFVIPEHLKKKELSRFIDDVFTFIHKEFFDDRATLSRRDRLTFIEIFYLMLSLKVAELLEVDSLSYTCKDALDTGPAQSAMLFGMVRMLSKEAPWTEHELDQLLWLTYSPALLVRERLVALPRYRRLIFTLEHIDRQLKKRRSTLIPAFNALYTTLHFPLTTQFAEPDAES